MFLGFFLGFFYLQCFRPEEGSAALLEKQNEHQMLGAEDEQQVGVTGLLTFCQTDLLMHAYIIPIKPGDW